MASGRTQTPPRRGGIGCAGALAIGFASIALLALLTCGGAAYWALSPGSQVETASLVGEESIGYLEVSDLASSKPVGELVQSVFEELDERSGNRDSAPEWLRSLQSAQRDYQSVLNSIVPSSVTATLEPSESGGLAWVTAVNFPRFTRPARLFLSRIAENQQDDGPQVNEVPYRDVTIYEFVDNASLTFLGGTLLASATPGLLQKGIDRVLESAPRRAPIRELEVPRPGSWDARGVIRGAAITLLGVAPELASTARLGARMDDADTAAGYLVVDCAGENEAASVEQYLKELLAARAQQAREDELTMEYQVARKGTQIGVDAKLKGVRAYLIRKLESQDEPSADDEGSAAEEAPAAEE